MESIINYVILFKIENTICGIKACSYILITPNYQGQPVIPGFLFQHINSRRNEQKMAFPFILFGQFLWPNIPLIIN